MLNLIQFMESRQLGRYSGQRTQKKPKWTKEEEFEMAQLAPLFKKIRIRGWMIDPTVHAAAQSYDRRPDLEYNDWIRIHHFMLNGLEKENAGHGEYVIYSQSYKQAYVVTVDPSRKRIRIITTLPKGRNRPNSPSTELMFVEGVEVKIIGTIEVE